MNGDSPPPPDAGDFVGANPYLVQYSLGISVGILLLIITITLASYYCTRHDHIHNHVHATAVGGDGGGGDFIVEVGGLDDETIKTYPEILYSQAKVKFGAKTASCCSICLGEYKEKDMLRQLPDCNHMFHVKCVDQWLRLHPTCPLCRTSPFPTPVSTPLADVTPSSAALRS